MDRAPLRKEFDEQTRFIEQQKQFSMQIAQLKALENTLIDGFNSLAGFLAKGVAKVETTNPVTKVFTPDIDKVVKSIEKFDSDFKNKDIDLAPFLKIFAEIKAELIKIPKEKATFEQKDTVNVGNFEEMNFDTSKLEETIKKAIASIDVKPDAPIINTEKVDLKPLQGLLGDILVKLEKNKPKEQPKSFKIDNLKDIKPTDTSKIEKKLDTGNKYLKEISEKRSGGGGGGESTLAFPLYADITTHIIKSGAVKTITETDGKITLTTTIDATDPNDKSITELWS